MRTAFNYLTNYIRMKCSLLISNSFCSEDFHRLELANILGAPVQTMRNRQETWKLGELVRENQTKRIA